jgi:hypothetical protein
MTASTKKMKTNRRFLTLTAGLALFVNCLDLYRVTITEYPTGDEPG